MSRQYGAVRLFFSVEYPTTSQTVAPAPTSTSTVADVLPPAPLQVRVNVWLEPSVPVLWLPLSALDPAQAPEAVQSVALDVDQLNVEEPPTATEVGLADSETVGPCEGEGDGVGVGSGVGLGVGEGFVSGAADDVVEVMLPVQPARITPMPANSETSTAVRK